jgi:hypothetical protein
MRIARARSLLWIAGPVYYAVLGVTTIAAAIALGALMSGIAMGMALLAFAFWLTKRIHESSRRLVEDEAARCIFTADTLCHEGPHGHTVWSYDAIRSIEARDRWLVLTLRGELFLVVSDQTMGDQSLASWIAMRATHLTHRPSRTRVLLLLGILYIAIAIAIVAVLPAFIAP